MAEKLRERVSSFVNNHVDLWVTVENSGTLVLASNDPVALLRAAADWLAEDPEHTVTDGRWQSGPGEPGHTLRLALREAAAGTVPPQRRG